MGPHAAALSERDDDVEHRDEPEVEERVDKRWGRKSLRKKRSYRISNSAGKKKNSKPATKLEVVEQSSFESCMSIHEENEVVGEGSVDGFELSMNNGAMQLLHVLGIKQNVKDEVPRGKRPLMPVQFSRFATNYYPLSKGHSLHRVAVESLSKGKPPKDDPDDMLHLLENYDPFDEESAVKEELKKGTMEMRALESDLKDIGFKMEQGPTFVPKCHDKNVRGVWDIDSLLEQPETDNIQNAIFGLKNTDDSQTANEQGSSKTKISWEERRVLVKNRGNSFVASFDDPITNELFVQKCGCAQTRQPLPASLRGVTSSLKYQKVAANAGAIRHFAITNNAGKISFFLSKDDSKTYSDDNLPARLRTRISQAFAYITWMSSPSVIKYLTCGPNESYFAELTTGEYLWGISQPDEEFKTVMSTFHVHRVAFGPFTHNDHASETSWIVIGKDGTTAWRNIPCRLEALLKKRKEDEAAPCEVSLGEEGAYFVKFLDGTVDYCLPAHMSDICEKIVEQGGSITNIAMHPEISSAFLIRHTKIS